MSVKKRGTWTVEAWYRNSMGERHKKTKRGFASKKEAVAWERDFLASCNERVEVTVEAFVKTMYARDIYPRLRVGTRLTKDVIIDKYILPIFGPMRLCDVKAADVVRWENWLLEQNLSQSYLHTICNQFSAIFNHAVRFYRLPQNPMLAAGKVGSKRPEKEMLYWTPAEFKRFSQAIEDKPLILHSSRSTSRAVARASSSPSVRKTSTSISTLSVSVIPTPASRARTLSVHPRRAPRSGTSSCRASFVRSCVIICRHIPRSPLPTGSSPSRSTRCRMR